MCRRQQGVLIGKACRHAAPVAALYSGRQYGNMPAYCYLCGREIKSRVRTRRKVQTGEWVRRDYKRSRIESVQIHFNRRVVCGFCARQLDRESFWLTIRTHGTVLLWLAGLLVIVAFMR